MNEKDDQIDHFVDSASLGLTIYTALQSQDMTTLTAVEEGYTAGEQFEAVLDLLNISLDMLGLAIGKEDEELYAALRASLTRIQGER